MEAAVAAAAAAVGSSSMLMLRGGLNNSGVVLSLLAVLSTMVWRNPQLKHFLARHLRRHVPWLASMVNPYETATVLEYDEGGRMKRSDMHKEVKAYLSSDAACSARGVRHVRVEAANDPAGLVLSMCDGEEVSDEFQGAKVWWEANSDNPPAARSEERRRFYRLYFLERHRALVLGEYLRHVRRQGRDVMVKSRQRKLFTNIPTSQGGGFMRSAAWSHVAFEHPMTFPKLAMDPVEKEKITDDLDTFKERKDYYAHVGKAWKQGYLLYGPPGTGKSAMIAAMANYLDYDIYDIELTSVNSNTDLRRLFIETTSKSIIVIEDIDCSLDLTGARDNKKKTEEEDDKKDGGGASSKEIKKDTSSSKVTLSWLLNFIDGLWSACGGERIIVFTTNHVDKLDPALIRKGRMDNRIKMSYCGFEAFKFLAQRYLDLDPDVDSPPQFESVRKLLHDNEMEMTPADVAEYLTPKRDNGPDSCLDELVTALKEAKKNKASGGNNQQEQQDN